MTAPQAKTGMEVERLPELPRAYFVRRKYVNKCDGSGERISAMEGFYTADQVHEYAKAYATASIAAERAEAVRMADHINVLREALEGARDHLNYMGYGDSWERECARTDGLPAKIEKAISYSTTTADLTRQREALEALAKYGTHHDTCPTRLLCNPATNELAGKIDGWWLSYFQGADAQVRKIARAALSPSQQGEPR